MRWFLLGNEPEWAVLGLGTRDPRSALLGEFPTRGSARSLAEILAVARAAGYAAAWPWSVLSTDDSTDRLACVDAVAAQARRA